MSADLPESRCAMANEPGHQPHDFAVTGEWPKGGPHRRCVGGPPKILPKSAGVLEEVSHERVRQDAKWGEQNHPDGTGSVWEFCSGQHAGWAEEAADDARRRCQEAPERSWGDTYALIPTGGPDALATRDHHRPVPVVPRLRGLPQQHPLHLLPGDLRQRSRSPRLCLSRL